VNAESIWRIPQAACRFWCALNLPAKIIVGLVLVSMIGGQGPRERRDYESSEFSAWRAAKELVSARLLCPSTASFPSEHQATRVAGGTDRWQVIGDVDSQNTYGAMLRRRFVAIVEADTVGNWSLVSLHFN
jgi:hypothetical protein